MKAMRVDAFGIGLLPCCDILEMASVFIRGGDKSGVLTACLHAGLL